MTINFPLSLPAVGGIKTIGLRSVNAVMVSASPFTFKQQVFSHTGQRWESEVSLRPMGRADAEEWIAWLMSLRGSVGTFLMGDPLGVTARGSVGGSPVVSGAAQTGSILNITGATISQTNWARAGDYIQLGSASGATLHKVLQAANSDGSGNVALDIWPSMRAAPADASAVVVTGTKGLWRLTTNSTEWNADEMRVYGITFAAVEAIF